MPRFRQRLADVPLDQGRPVWVDDPHFNLRYHLRHAGLPAPGSEEQLKNLAGRLFAQRLDRTKPLWELWLVDGLQDERFALVAKSHHALVDGIEAVDITTVLFDTEPARASRRRPPPPLGAAAAADRRPAARRRALRARDPPAELVRTARAVRAHAAPAAARRPRRAAGDGRARVRRHAPGPGDAAERRGRPAPPLHLGRRRARRAAARQGQPRRHRQRRRAGGRRRRARAASCATAASTPRGWLLRALVPVLVRGVVARPTRSATRSRRCGSRCRSASRTPSASTRRSATRRPSSTTAAQAVGARTLTELAGFAPPTIMSQAARLQQRQRFFNLVVTNVPGPAAAAVPARAPAARAVPGRPARRAPGARRRGHELRRPARLRPARRLRRARRSRHTRRHAARLDRRARRRRLGAPPRRRGRRATRDRARAARHRGGPPRGARADGRQGAARTSARSC